jgi:nitrite reductase/ring-hydroxylating ferredoxin subunit
MGDLLRRYWVPALLAGELPGPDCDPVRVKLLHEHLVAFRDTDGRLGLIDEFCAHRASSLFYGRNEEGGLRCCYHGWKYDVQGRCVDMPSEPEDSAFKDKIRLRSYRLEERGGIIWAYMGPSEHQPPLPELEWALVPAAQSFVSKRLQECNFVQAMEGGIDSSHVSVLHRFDIANDPLFKGSLGHEYLQADTRPKFEVVESPGGLYIAARRNVDTENYYWRITQWVMPWYTLIPPFAAHNPLGGHAWVPIDDETCWAWSVNFHPTRELTLAELGAMHDGEGIHVEYEPGTFRPKANASNDYMIDRDAQRRRETFSGIRGIAIQDTAVQESMGAVVDRTKERLGTSDAGIIMARHRLMQAARTLRGDGAAPVGVSPESHRVRAASVVLPKGLPFDEGAKDAMIALPETDVAAL